MQVEIILTVNEMADHLVRGKTAVIIDTLRATSTIVTALYNGAVTIEPKAGIDEALERASQLPASSFVLGGEREGVKIEGFHLGNSPQEYTKEMVRGKTVILSTTNGTKTIQRAREAERILIGSLLNAGATMVEAARHEENLIICCAGTKGNFSLEDFVTAGACISRLKQLGVHVEGDDRVNTAWLLYERYTAELPDLMSCSQNGIRLVEIGLQDDIDYCAAQDLLPVICFFDGVRINAIETEAYLYRR